MKVSTLIQDINGSIIIQVEGFFTERFINLCKINNIKIWDIRQIVQGVIRAKMHISDFKKLIPIARKTKCQVKIKDKRGLYFTFFKYRKKKVLMYILAFFIFFIILFSMFIWRIDIVGNSTITNDRVISELKKSGVYVGKFKIGLSKKEVVNRLRVNMPELSWAGIEITGTRAKVEVVEKTVSKNQEQDFEKNGDIIADKSGVITKIIAENGTCKYKTGSYIAKDYILIEGAIYSKILEPQFVHAKGIVRIQSKYSFEKEYKFKQIKKEYTNKTKYTVGISINNKENMLNYLNKNKKYDITKNGKQFKLFSHDVSLDIYKCVEYIQKDVIYSKEQLVDQAKADSKAYIDSIMSNCITPYIVNEEEQITDIGGGIKYQKIYTVDEQIGKFIERNN